MLLLDKIVYDGVIWCLAKLGKGRGFDADVSETGGG